MKMLRKERLGRNSLIRLGYYAGYRAFEGKAYSELSIHEKITLRSRIFCVVDGDFREFLNWMNITL